VPEDIGDDPAGCPLPGDPFASSGRWVAARDLEPGDELLTMSGSTPLTARSRAGALLLLI